ncbi:MAG: hypothetical protein HUK22_01670 [Thermoguttaceae bacterium]|nr:hypothetical protein [Thermoguttaceae bacterium]
MEKFSEASALRRLREQTLETLFEMGAEPKPSYALDGVSVSWNEYRGRLLATLEWCDARLRVEEPLEIRSLGAVE